MANHMNSPKIKKAIEAAKELEAAFKVVNEANIEWIQENEPDLLSADDRTVNIFIMRKQAKINEIEENFRAAERAEKEARRLVWAYYKSRKLSNREILSIASNIF